MPGSFFDTNVLLYLTSSDVRKADRVEEILVEGGTISVQVMNELTRVARRKMRMSWPEVNEFRATMKELLTISPITLEIHETGVALAERYDFSVFDAMIVAAALHSDCDTLWSEDMQHAMRVRGLRIRNPFAAA